MSHCGEVSHIFDVLDMKTQAKQHDTELLGKIPLRQDLRGSADKQIPFMADDSTDADTREIFTEIAQNITVYSR